MKNILVSAVLLILASSLHARQDSLAPAPGLTISGYLEPYYSYDFSEPDGHEKPSFLYNFNRHNEVNLNLGFLKANYTADRYRGNLAIMTGTYAQYNLAAEQPVLRHVYEANAGVKLSRNHELWLDGGIMTSHIGFESAIGKDNWTLTRSLFAENSPYYESGARLSYTSSDGKWFLAVFYLNGWQRIARVNGNNSLNAGSQLTYKPNEAITLNWSTFAGNDKPDSVKQMRYFNNFYGIFQITERLGLITGVDVGFEEKARPDDGAFNLWYTPVVIARFGLNDKLNLAARAEYYSDENGVIIASGSPNGFKTLGYSLNLDYQISGNALFRIEGKGYTSQDELFILDDQPSRNNFSFTTSLCISF